MSAPLRINIAATPFPWTAAALAAHQGVPLDWTHTGEIEYDGKQGVQAVEEALSALYKGKENALPELPAEFNASTPFPAIPNILNKLDDHLALRTTFSSPHSAQPGATDLKVWGTIRVNLKVIGVLKQGKHAHLGRWYAFIEGLDATQEVVQGLFNAKSSNNKASKAEKNKAGTVEASLPNAIPGQVVLRFAPEPSGYLHIGHIKACILNRALADKYNGKMLLRFDDTNPEKEDDEFEGSFQSDLEMLGVKWDGVVHTSDHFEKIQEFAKRLIEQGDAFMDDTDQLTMREQRMALIPSKNRDASVATNLAHFSEMCSGSEEGQKWFLRAKIDYTSPNGAMRDPAVYRCINKAHHVTGEKYKAYPMYDLACPVVDALDGVTHALRANEYADRKPQYEWFLEKLGLKKIEIFDFSRLDFVYTLLSKRKLKHLVEQGLVKSWEDPRFPTIRGMRARGLTIEALKGFIASQGASSSTLLMEWDQLWAWNKKVIDPIAPRYWAVLVEDAFTLMADLQKPEVRTLPAHKKNPAVGDKKTVFSSDLLMEQIDAESFGDNEEITAMDWGNAFVNSKKTNSAGKIESLELELHLEGDFKKTSKKVHWLSAPTAEHPLVPVTLIDYDYLINKKKIEDGDDFTACLNPVTEYRVKAVADANVENLKKFDIIQFERKGFYIYQGTKDAEGRMEFGFIPDGRISTVALKGQPFKEASTADVGAPGEKGWGKDTNATAAKAPGADAKTEGKVYLSNVTSGFEIPSTDNMYAVDRLYGKEDIKPDADNVNMYKVKPVYEP
ncbi:hypothetical protein QFC20_005258 [Naganishia adeliensis]|uniref:Uncharacterized protein n=1 Tax=Naganishia adeliensis TaxID=92952 RepID=A0ACC2VPX7_9TREE|nr:hypothetical protein QFC20_005258 [Naganishia adeliensis]